MELKHSLEDFINKCKWGYGIKSDFKLVGFTLKAFLCSWRRMWTCRAKVCQISTWRVKIYTYTEKHKVSCVVDLQGQHYLLLPTSDEYALLYRACIIQWTHSPTKY